MSLFLHLRNSALHHLLSNGCSAVNGCRQNESPNSWLKHQINPHHSSPSVNILSCEVKSCVFVRNHWDILTVNHHCLPKHKSIIHNKVYSLSHQNPLTYLLRTFWTVYRAWSVHISLLIQHNFSLKKAILCIEERWSEIKTVLNRDLFISNMQLFTSQYINWWTGVVWIIVMF